MIKQEKITKGIVIRAIDWGEKDKIITVFTLDYGKISLKLRGVRSPKSIMKFASFPLAYIEFTFVGNGDILTCTQANEVANFFDLSLDYDKLSYASAVLEVLDSITIDNVRDSRLFYTAVNTLFYMCKSDIPILLIFAKFLSSILYIMGVMAELNVCKSCGNNFSNGARLNLDSGEIVCLACPSTPSSVLLSPIMLAELSLLHTFTFDNLHKLRLNHLPRILDVLLQNIQFRLGKRLKSIKFQKKF